ncbi:hypothetical protein CFP56_005446 [Quercus suber]|uniref:Uncharacterized protein n=1 Tax=Quercus suber TaxID=58331 RepID=A0AAW0LAR2_QUESU
MRHVSYTTTRSLNEKEQRLRLEPYKYLLLAKLRSNVVMGEMDQFNGILVRLKPQGMEVCSTQALCHDDMVL